MGTSAGNRDNSTEAVVIFPNELQQVLPLNLANRLHRSGQWTTKRVPRPHCLREQFLRKLARLILIHQDLLPNHVPRSISCSAKTELTYMSDSTFAKVGRCSEAALA